jgi:signal transduction histidine kinase
MKISLQPSLLLLLCGTVLVALVPGGLMLDRQLRLELERAARDELAIAPRLLEDRNAARGDALMMHAKDLAASPALIEAFRDGDPAAAVRAAREARFDEREQVVVVSGEAGEPWAGPMPDDDMVAATREGQMPVSFLPTPDGPAHMALAPVMDADTWLGAAGVLETLDESGVAALAGLTSSEVVVESPYAARMITTLDSARAEALVRAAGSRSETEGTFEVLASGSRWWVAVGPLESSGRVLFARNVQEELAVLPRLRRGAAIAGGVALLLVLLLGSIAAGAVARPVHALADASERLTAGDFEAPLPDSSLREVDRVALSFAHMRNALERRLEELQEANRTLATQKERLQALQGELIQRDRLAASGRLVAELAHEIRNPVASIRNCLEVLDRRLADDPEARVFSRLAIEELARMHELAEGLLDLNRPVDPEASEADPAAVAEQVAALMGAGKQGERWPITVFVPAEGLRTAIAPDALKQVLINLVQNAQEAMADGGPIEIEGRADHGRMHVTVADHGTGIPDDILPRVFDPFFTTKGEVRGVGLGLFVAEGIVRRYGGALTARNREDGDGAAFTLELPIAAAPKDAS